MFYIFVNLSNLYPRVTDVSITLKYHTKNLTNIKKSCNDVKLLIYANTTEFNMGITCPLWAFLNFYNIIVDIQ